MDLWQTLDRMEDRNEALGFLKREHQRLLDEHNQLISQLGICNMALEKYLHNVRGGISEALGVLDAVSDNIEDGNNDAAQLAIKKAVNLLSSVFEYQSTKDTTS